MNANQILTLAIAGSALLLSVFTLVLHQREKRQIIKVKLWLGFAAVGPSKPEDIVIIEAANAGSVDVHLSNCCIKLPNNKNFVANFYYDKKLPVTLAPGEAVQAFLESEKFRDTMLKEGYEKEIQVIAEFSNKAGRAFHSKPEELNLDEMLFAKENA